MEVVEDRGDNYTRVWVPGLTSAGIGGDMRTSDLEQYQGATTYTENEFTQACEQVLGIEVAQVMLKGTVGGKVTTMNMAINQAFVHGCTDAKAIAVLRSIAKGLNDLGYLAFRQD
jgi:hypothetical protein